MGSYLQIGGVLPRRSAGRRAEARKRAGECLTEPNRVQSAGGNECRRQGGGKRAQRGVAHNVRPAEMSSS